MAIGYFDKMSGTHRALCVRRAETFCRAMPIKIGCPYDGSCQRSECLCERLRCSRTPEVCPRLRSVVLTAVHGRAERNLACREWLLHHEIRLRIDDRGWSHLKSRSGRDGLLCRRGAYCKKRHTADKSCQRQVFDSGFKLHDWFSFCIDCLSSRISGPKFVNSWH